MAGLVLLGSCQPASPTERSCPVRPHLLAARDTFDLIGQETRANQSPEEDSLQLPSAHQQRWLQGAYFVGGMLADSVTPTSYGGGAYYYGQVRSLLRSPKASCHQVVYVTSDEFSGLFLVIGFPNRPANLYLSGSVGSSYEEGGYHYSGDVTSGIVLNDSTVITKTGRTAYSFRNTQRPSYADTVSRRYHIDYQASRFVLLDHYSVRTYLPDKYFD